MPVEDHEVHEKVRISADDPYGCHSARNPVTSDGYYAPDRVYRPDGTYHLVLTYIKHVTSKDCRSFYLWDTDPRCRGCAKPKDIEYALRMRGLE